MDKNQIDRNKIQNRNNGRVTYSSKNCRKCQGKMKLKRIGSTFLVAIVAFSTGTIMASKKSDGPSQDNQNSYSSEYTQDNKGLFKLDSDSEKNDFMHDKDYTGETEININNCDFSNISVVLNAADEEEKTYSDLYYTKEQFDSLGIDCTLVSYYDSAIDTIEQIKNETNNTVYVTTVQNGKNNQQKHFVLTNYENNDDALGISSTELGDSNSSDVFALAVKSSISDVVGVKKGLGIDTNNYDRKASTLENEISEKGLKGVKAITIRPSNNHQLSQEELSTGIVNGIVKASTLDNNQTYFVRANSWQTYKDSYGNTGSYATAGSIKNRYPNAPQPECDFEDKSFYSDATILTRPIPVQLTNNITVNLDKTAHK